MQKYIVSVSKNLPNDIVILRAGDDKKCPVDINNFPMKNWTTRTESDPYDPNWTNYAMLTGAVSGIWVLDIDNKENNISEMFDWFSLNGYDPTIDSFTVQTQSGGYHIYFNYDKLCNISKRYNVYNDIQGNGQCVIFINSQYPKGTYELINDVPIGPAPEFIMEAMFITTDKEESDIDTIISNSNYDYIVELLNLLDDSYYEDYNKWLDIGMILFNELGYSEAIDAYNEFSKKSKDKYKGLATIIDKIDSFKVDSKNKLRIGTLVVFVKECNPDGFDKLQNKNNMCEYNKASSFDFKIKYDIIDLKEEFNNRKYDSLRDLKDAITNKLMSVCAYITDLDCFVIKSNGNLKTIKKVNGCLPKVLIKSIADKYTVYNLQNEIIDNILFNYNSVDYILNDYKNDRVFNIFRGYDANITTDIDQGVIDTVLDLLLNVFCNGDKNILRYILTWFSNIVSTSGMNKVALVLVSQIQGTGKSTIIEFLSKILGSHCCKSISGIGQVTQKHNTCLEGVRLLIMNEAASARDEFRSNFDKLKSIITDPTINIEPKGLASYEAKNIGNYIIVSNHRDSVVVESHDRRYQILECGDKYANDVQYFTKIRRILQLDDAVKMDAADSFYTYLMNYKDKVDLFKIIDTPLRQEMKDRSLPNTVKFVKEYQEKINSYDSLTGLDHICNIKAADIYAKYKRWCDDNTEKVSTSTKFGTDIKSYSNKVHKKDGWYYIFTKTN